LAADRIGQGELDVRAAAAGASGETAELVKRFNAMADEVQSYERERRILTAGIAHELRTPLTVMKGRLHGIVDGVLPLDPSEVHRLLRHADQLSHLIDDLRTLAHVDAGELKLELGPVAVDTLVLTVMDDLRERAAAADVCLQFQGTGGLALADPSRLSQIVTNLLANAIRHSPSGGVVAVHTHGADGWMVIAVEDSGDGIDAATQERMFGPFWRGTNGRDKDGSGSGLGLTLALMLAEAQGGTLEGANRTSGGAVFRLKLPGACAD
jgi:signal transduction histidine kinase